jgi:hypothetical protein
MGIFLGHVGASQISLERLLKIVSSFAKDANPDFDPIGNGLSRGGRGSFLNVVVVVTAGRMSYFTYYDDIETRTKRIISSLCFASFTPLTLTASYRMQQRTSTNNRVRVV